MTGVHAEGSLCGGRYHLERVRGRGPHGVVFEATDQHTGRTCAVKRMFPQFHDPDLLAAVLREAADAACLGQPHVLAPFDSGFDETGSLFLVSDLHPGESLRSRLRRGPLGPSETLAVLSPLCAALDAAHQTGLAHGDLTPDNLLLPIPVPPLADAEAAEAMEAGAASPGLVQVSDFGMHQLAAAAGAAPGVAAGYLPPEVYRGELPRASVEADVFALGALIFECLHGQPLFAAADTASVIYKICMAPLRPVTAMAPAQRMKLDSIIAMACKKGETVRFGSATALLHALRTVLLDRPPPESAPPPPPAASAPVVPPQGAVPAAPQPVAAEVSQPTSADSLDGWLVESGGASGSEPSVTRPFSLVELTPRWGNLALWASAGCLTMALILLAVRVSSGGLRTPGSAGTPSSADATAPRSAAASDLAVVQALLRSAEDSLSKRDYSAALSQAEAVLDRGALPYTQREGALAVQRAATDALRAGLLFDGLKRAAERGEVDTALALYREMPSAAPQRIESIPLLQALRDRAAETHLQLARAAQGAGQCDEVRRQQEQLRQLRLLAPGPDVGPSAGSEDATLAEGRDLLRRCLAAPLTTTTTTALAPPPAARAAEGRRPAHPPQALGLKNPF